MKKFHGLVVKLSRDDVDSLVSSSDDVVIFSCSKIAPLYDVLRLGKGPRAWQHSDI